VRSLRFDQGTDTFSFVSGEVVHDDHLPLFEVGTEEVLDVGLEGSCIGRSLNDHVPLGETLQAERSDQRQVLPTFLGTSLDQRYFDSDSWPTVAEKRSSAPMRIGSSDGVSAKLRPR
jgi:hypothetical protein